jgi:hypothetical protein
VRLCYNTLIRGADGGRSRAEVNAAKSWQTTVIADWRSMLMKSWGHILVTNVQQEGLGKGGLSALSRSTPRISKCLAWHLSSQSVVVLLTPTPWGPIFNCWKRLSLNTISRKTAHMEQRHLIGPLFTLIQPCGPIFSASARHRQISTGWDT